VGGWLVTKALLQDRRVRLWGAQGHATRPACAFAVRLTPECQAASPLIFVQVLPNRNGLIVEYKLSCCGATSRAINDNSL
jgi:hypothetical protein